MDTLQNRNDLQRHPERFQVNESDGDDTSSGTSKPELQADSYTYELTLKFLQCGDVESLGSVVKNNLHHGLREISGAALFYEDRDTGQIFTADESGTSFCSSQPECIRQVFATGKPVHSELGNLPRRIQQVLTVSSSNYSLSARVECYPVLDGGGSSVDEAGSSVLAVLVVCGHVDKDSAKLVQVLKQIAACYNHIQRTFQSVRGGEEKVSQQLIKLCGELYDQDAAQLQLKVLKYLEEQTQAQCAFLYLVVPETQELFCQVIGKKILQEEERFPGHTSCFSVALESKQPMTLEDIPVESRKSLEEKIEAPLQSFLCVPVTSRSDNNLIALTCVANKQNAARFTDRDISCIRQCFRYTSTVLTSTLAFQNERKLKTQTQALLRVARDLFTNLGEFSKAYNRGQDKFPYIESNKCLVDCWQQFFLDLETKSKTYNMQKIYKNSRLGHVGRAERLNVVRDISMGDGDMMRELSESVIIYETHGTGEANARRRRSMLNKPETTEIEAAGAVGGLDYLSIDTRRRINIPYEDIMETGYNERQGMISKLKKGQDLIEGRAESRADYLQEVDNWTIEEDFNLPLPKPSSSETQLSFRTANSDVESDFEDTMSCIDLDTYFDSQDSIDTSFDELLTKGPDILGFTEKGLKKAECEKNSDAELNKAFFSSMGEGNEVRRGRFGDSTNNANDEKVKLEKRRGSRYALRDASIAGIQAPTAVVDTVDLNDLTKLLREIMQQARNLTQAERCSVFLLDRDTDELVAKVFDGITPSKNNEVQEEIRLPSTQGIAGKVATSGELLNIKDAYSHPLFYRGIDDSTGFRTRNILCFPIKDEKGVILGVAQLCNKQNCPCFTTFDEEIATAFGIYCCISISHSLMYKKVIDSQVRSSLANELMMYHMKSLMYKKLLESQHRKSLANELMIYHMQVSPEDVQGLATVDIPHPRMLDADFLQFSYSPRSLPDEKLLLACLSMFEDLNIISRWRIKRDTLARFVLMVKKGYRNPPYHNWLHAYTVAQFCYQLVKNLKLENSLDDIEVFALFVSCLCHDIDHRGTNNTFQTASKSVLAALYSSEGSVLERHHFAQTMCILNTEGCNVFENLSSKDYQNVLDLMRDIILATDLAHHFKILKSLREMADRGYNKHCARDRKILLCLLMTSCDLSDQTRPWENTKRVAALIYKEFFSQGDMEKAKGLEPIDMMDRERAQIPALQIGFLDHVALPVYKLLGKLYPGAEEVAERVEDNKQHWEKISNLIKLKRGGSQARMTFDEVLAIENEVDADSSKIVNGT